MSVSFHVDLSTVEGWDQFVHRPTPSKPSLTKAAYRRLSDSERVAYDRTRRDYRKFPYVIETPRLASVCDRVAQLVRCEIGGGNAPPGLLLSGIGGTGKTTAIAATLRSHQLHLENQDAGWRDRLPVLFVESPAKPNASAVIQSLAKTLNYPTKGMSDTQLLDAMCAFLTDQQLQVMAWDEMQKMYPKSRGSEGEQVSNVLRTIQNATGCVLIGSGINLESKGLFTGTFATTTATRNPRVAIGPFDWDCTADGWVPEIEDIGFPKPPEGREAFLAVLAAMERHLCLFDHKPGDLTRNHARYIHDRTAGKLVSIAVLLRGAADLAMIDAARDGSPERITVDHMNRVPLDDHANEHYRTVLTERAKTAKKRKPKTGATQADKPFAA